MLHFFKKHLLKFSTIYNEILFFILLPLLITIMITVIIIVHNYTYLKKQTNIGALSFLEHYSHSCESTILNIISSSKLLENNPQTNNALKNSISNIPDYDMSVINQTLNNFTSGQQSVDSVFIYDKDNTAILTPSGLFDSDEFFSKYYKYQSYPLSYWNQLRFIYSSGYRVLSPSTVNEGDEEKNIIPVVFRRGSFKYDPFLIININLDVLTNQKAQYKFTENTNFLILNRYSGQLFSGDSALFDKNISGTDLYEQLVSDTPVFTYNFKGLGKSYIVKYSTSSDIVGYTYFAVIPQKDYFSLLSSMIILVTVLLILLLLLIIPMACYSAKKLYAPLKNIQLPSAASEKGISSYSELAFLIDKINTESLFFKSTLPLAHERFLIKLLKSENDNLFNNEIKSIMSKSLPFVGNLFRVAIIRLVPKKRFFSLFNNDEFRFLQAEFYNIVMQLFEEKFNCFSLSSHDGELIFIINSQDNDLFAETESLISEICNYLKNDNEIITLYVGLGNVHTEFSGIRKSYNEASEVLEIVNLSGKQNNADNGNGISFSFVSKDEASFYNALISGNSAEATNILNSILEKNQYVDSRSAKQLYSQILSIILKVLRIKNLLFSDRLDIEIQNDILDNETDIIYKNILHLIRTIDNKTDVPEQTETSKMIDYITQNYHNPIISLDLIAGIFNTKPKYVSQIVKNTLGIGFHEYLSNLRVSRAKMLLDETQMSIKEISEKVGFNSTQTFFRTFKAQTGLTPKAYRGSAKK